MLINSSPREDIFARVHRPDPAPAACADVCRHQLHTRGIAPAPAVAHAPAAVERPGNFLFRRTTSPRTSVGVL